MFYAGTKSAASAITKGLAAEYAPVGIRVNAVEPVAGDSALVPPRYALAGNIGGKARAPSLIGGMLSPGEDATTPAVSGQMSASLGRSKSGELDAPGQSQTLSKSRATSFGSTGSATSSIGATSSQAVVSQGIPLGRWATARDVANAAAFLCSDEADFITGVCLRVDGGRSLN